MSGFLQGRRRWTAVVVVLALLIVPPLAWHFRPLTAVERKLVGVWISTSNGVRSETTFYSNKTVVTHSSSLDGGTLRDDSSEETSTSSWRCSGNTLYMTIPIEDSGPLTLAERMQEWFSNVFGEDITPSFEVTFDSDNRIRIRNPRHPEYESTMERSTP